MYYYYCCFTIKIRSLQNRHISLYLIACYRFSLWIRPALVLIWRCSLAYCLQSGRFASCEHLRLDTKASVLIKAWHCDWLACEDFVQEIPILWQFESCPNVQTWKKCEVGATFECWEIFKSKIWDVLLVCTAVTVCLFKVFTYASSQ